MSRFSDKGLSLGELAALRDDEIDLSDIPELTDEFFLKAKRVLPADTERVTLQVPRATLDAFRARGEGYELVMSAVLERFAQRLTR